VNALALRFVLQEGLRTVVLGTRSSAPAWWSHWGTAGLPYLWSREPGL